MSASNGETYNIDGSSSSSSQSEGYNSNSSDPDYTPPPKRPRTDRPSTSVGVRSRQQRSAPTTNNPETDSDSNRRTRRRQQRGSGSSRRPTASSSNSTPKTVIRKRTITSWLQDLGVVQENDGLYYLDPSSEKVLQRGEIRYSGIFCQCCKNVITPYEFEQHAGSSYINRPYANIFLDRNTKSLLQCQREVWKEQFQVDFRSFNLIKPKPKAVDAFDDACIMCADGGNLICCENCPSTYHPHCMNMENAPAGPWICPYCVCYFCGSNSDAGEPLLSCDQCDKKYHWRCAAVGTEYLAGFCSLTCEKVHLELEQKIGMRNHMEHGFSWMLLHTVEEPKETLSEELHRIMQCNSKIAVAWGVLHECFIQILDRLTRINMVQSVVYSRGSNFVRINFRGFCCVILEENDQIISVACIRMHANKVAEMPFIGTAKRYRCRGMSRKLMTVTQSFLRNLGMEHLVIPSVPDLVDMWTTKFDFCPVGPEVIEKLTSINTVMFAGSVRLCKSLLSTPEEAGGPSDPAEPLKHAFTEDAGPSNSARSDPACLGIDQAKLAFTENAGPSNPVRSENDGIKPVPELGQGAGPGVKLQPAPEDEPEPAAQAAAEPRRATQQSGETNFLYPPDLDIVENGGPKPAPELEQPAGAGIEPHPAPEAKPAGHDAAQQNEANEGPNGLIGGHPGRFDLNAFPDNDN